MRKSSNWFGLIALVTAACGGEFYGLEGEPQGDTPDASTPGPDAAPDPAAIARAKFDEKVAPILPTCLACHSTAAPGVGAPGFMDPTALYNSIKSSGYIVPGKPNDSTLVTYPTPSTSHPIKLTAQQSDDIKAWIALEPDPNANTTDPSQPNALTPKIAVQAGANELDLTMLNPALTGAKLTFQLEMLSGGTTWFLSQIKVKAGPDMGVEVDTPLATWWDGTVTPAQPKPDPVSSLSGMKVNVVKATEVDLGTVVLVDVRPGSMLSFTFKKLATYTGTGGAPVNNINCKAVADFLTNAKPPLQTSCATAACHGNAGSGAGSAWNLSLIASNVASEQATLCATVKSKLNLGNAGADIDTSIMFRRPDPAVATHPFKFPDANAVNNFRNTVKLWGTKEI